MQTPAAAGSTRSPAGAQGTGLGVFNLIRFGGSAVGAAWVTIGLGSWSVSIVFVVCALVVGSAFAATFLGRDPEDVEDVAVTGAALRDS